jgi:hypothetical protein
MSDPQLMSVRTELVKEVMVGRIVELVLERSERGALPPAAAKALERAPDALRGRSGVDEPARRLAADGYLARAVETELFEPARRTPDWLAARGKGHDAARVCLQLALVEPLGRPDPDDQRAATWRVPGPGGHVRHYVALRLVEERVGGSSDGDAPLLKRAFVYGFLLRCCDEPASP